MAAGTGTAGTDDTSVDLRNGPGLAKLLVLHVIVVVNLNDVVASALSGTLSPEIGQQARMRVA